MSISSKVLAVLSEIEDEMTSAPLGAYKNSGFWIAYRTLRGIEAHVDGRMYIYENGAWSE